MGQLEKLMIKVLAGTNDNNILFKNLCNLLISLGFEERIKGSHHIFYRYDINEILNLQSKGSKAKGYQVKQVRNMILRYKLGGFKDV